MPQPKHQYQVTVIKVIDGDTIKVAVDLGPSHGKDADFGFHLYRENNRRTLHESIRLAGLNANEHGTPAGEAAKAWLIDALSTPTPLMLHTTVVADHDAQEKYGRWLGTFWLRGEPASVPSINARMIAAGHALPWDGHGARPV